MKGPVSTLLLRIEAILLVLFAAGHTFGFLTFDSRTAEARAVDEAMRRVTFPAGGRQSTYYDFYAGFGLSVSAYLLFIAYLSWHLGAMARMRNPSFAGIARALAVLELANLSIAMTLFAPAPVILCAAVLMLTVVAIWRGAKAEAVTKATS